MDLRTKLDPALVERIEKRLPEALVALGVSSYQLRAVRHIVEEVLAIPLWADVDEAYCLSVLVGSLNDQLWERHVFTPEIAAALFAALSVEASSIARGSERSN